MKLPMLPRKRAKKRAERCGPVALARTSRIRDARWRRQAACVDTDATTSERALAWLLDLAGEIYQFGHGNVHGRKTSSYVDAGGDSIPGRSKMNLDLSLARRR
jgi:hypothetical protein